MIDVSFTHHIYDVQQAVQDRGHSCLYTSTHEIRFKVIKVNAQHSHVGVNFFLQETLIINL